MNNFCQHSIFTESGRPLTSLVIRPSKDIPFDEKKRYKCGFEYVDIHTSIWQQRKTQFQMSCFRGFSWRFACRNECALVRWSVRYASAKTAFLSCFRPRLDPLLKQMINQHILRAPLPFSHSTHLFVHLSLHIYHMIKTRKDTARTQRCPVGLVDTL